MTPSFAHDTIAAAARALAAGTVSSRALVEASLQAISIHGPATNAFVHVDAAGARQAADAADRTRAAGQDLGPLHGIPISLKDLIDEAGAVTTAGSRVLGDRVAATDATVVARLRRAGAIVIGRTNLHEFALGTTSEDSAYGPVRHPADARRSAGGSSGGSAAAVALGMGLASVGTDTGGSVRIPAAACGIVGLKPGAGELPLDGVVPLSASLDHVGPIARTVQDAAILFDVMAGIEPRPLTSAPPSDVRLLWLDGYFAHPLEPAVRAATDAAAARLTRAGVSLRRGELPGTDAIAPAYVDIVLPEAAHWHGARLDRQADEYTAPVRQRLLQGRTIAAVNYLQAQAARSTLRAAVDALLEQVDALVLPTLPLVAPLLGAETVALEPDAAPVPVRTAMLKHTQPFNLTGHPALSLPVAASPLPVGLQLVGHRGQTRRLLEIAAGLERIVTCP
ncbi:MAG: amidase [Acidobacteria bacterium]|nr:amidase [Acidobacteriota bacterium]